MGRIIENIKAGAKSYYKGYKERSDKKKALRKELDTKVNIARREAYMEEAEIQARIKARLDALELNAIPK